MRPIQIDLTLPWSATEFAVLRRCVGKNGLLKSDRPKGDTHYDKWAYYVWRQLMWFLSDEREHQCTPVLCYYEVVQSESKALDELANKVLSLFPIDKWNHVISDWAKVLL